MFHLRFPANKVDFWAARYDYGGDDTKTFRRTIKAVRDRGWLLKKEFVVIAGWKSQRNTARYSANKPKYIEEVTRLALSPTTSEQLRIESLTLLDGVGWPIGSALLHFCHQDCYPVLDFRALWSLQCQVPSKYDFAFWQKYTSATRSLASRLNCDMRTLDKALWQYSNEQQKR